MNYLIAFGGKPAPTFLNMLRSLASGEGVEIRAAILTHGPGCYNLAYTLDEPNDAFANALTMALMPAKWSTTTDPIEGFTDEVNA